MPEMTIKIPNGFRTDEGIDCYPDDQGNTLYILTDEGEFGQPYAEPARPDRHIGANIVFNVPVGTASV